jgi:hypothetical protein
MYSVRELGTAQGAAVQFTFLRFPDSETCVIGSECQQIRPLGRDQRSRLAEPVTCRDLDPRQDRLVTGLCML